jgi:hypothetical protein
MLGSVLTPVGGEPSLGSGNQFGHRAYAPRMPTIGDDDRQYWNPMGLFAERLVSFRRRPGRSPLFTAAAVSLVAVVAVVILVVVIAIVT